MIVQIPCLLHTHIERERSKDRQQFIHTLARSGLALLVEPWLLLCAALADWDLAALPLALGAGAGADGAAEALEQGSSREPVGAEAAGRGCGCGCGCSCCWPPWLAARDA